MATARIKERMDHLMRYPVLKTQSPSPLRAALLTATALALFTVASGLAGSTPLAFAKSPARAPQAVLPAALPPAGAASEPAESPEEPATPAPALHAVRGGAKQAVAKAVLENPAHAADAVAAEPASSGALKSCPYVKCWITCESGLGYNRTFASAYACFSFSDAYGCRASGIYVCSDGPGPAGC